VSAADIAAGLLRFTPAANANGAGYASVYLPGPWTTAARRTAGCPRSDPRTMTVNVTAVNDAPAGHE
jgi:hypothetical protein